MSPSILHIYEDTKRMSKLCNDFNVIDIQKINRLVNKQNTSL